MSAIIVPIRLKRADTRALQLVRASIVADLTESKSLKNGESRALRALEVGARLWVAGAYLFALLTITALTLGVMGAALAIGFELGRAIWRVL